MTEAPGQVKLMVVVWLLVGERERQLGSEFGRRMATIMYFELAGRRDSQLVVV